MRVSSKEMRKFRRIVETTNFDHGHGDISDTFSLGGKKGDFETTLNGRADTATRKMNARYGDNAMKDIAKLDELDKTGIIDRLQDILNKAGVSDDEICASLALTDAGTHKVAAQLGVSASEVPMLIASLTTRLRDDENREESAIESAYESIMNEDDERFGYEKDGMGNVTVRDSQTGKSIYLQGSEATDLLNKLEQDPDAEQSILSGLESLMEGGIIDESDDPDDYIREMKQNSGTFNFPWKVGMKHGTGTAKYKFDGDDMIVHLLSVRDSEGNVMQINSGMKLQIEKIAHDFIVNEQD